MIFGAVNDFYELYPSELYPYQDLKTHRSQLDFSYVCLLVQKTTGVESPFRKWDGYIREFPLILDLAVKYLQLKQRFPSLKTACFSTETRGLSLPEHSV